MEGFQDSYKCLIMLEDDNNLVWVEKHENISLSDFEIIYGNICHNILKVELEIMKEDRKGGNSSSDNPDSEWKWKNNCEYY